MVTLDPTTVQPHQLLTCEAAATYSTLPQRTVRRLFSTRELPLVNVGRRLYVRAGDLDAYLAAQVIPAHDDLGGAR